MKIMNTARMGNPIYIYIYIYVCVCVCVCDEEIIWKVDKPDNYNRFISALL